MSKLKISYALIKYISIALYYKSRKNFIYPLEVLSEKSGLKILIVRKIYCSLNAKSSSPCTIRLANELLCTFIARINLS